MGSALKKEQRDQDGLPTISELLDSVLKSHFGDGWNHNQDMHDLCKDNIKEKNDVNTDNKITYTNPKPISEFKVSNDHLDKIIFSIFSSTQNEPRKNCNEAEFPLLTPAEAARFLEIPLWRLRELERKGSGPTKYKLTSKIIRYNPSDLSTFKEAYESCNSKSCKKVQ